MTKQFTPVSEIGSHFVPIKSSDFGFGSLKDKMNCVKN